MKIRLCCCAALLSLFALSVLAPPASAHKRDLFTYGWWTPGPGEKEIEPSLLYDPATHQWQGALEFEYGVTERWAVAPYVLFEREPGATWRTDGWKVEQRYRLGNYAPGRILPALYAEVAKENGDPYEVETKLLLAHETGPFSSALNLIAEREFASHEPVKWGYSAGTSLAVRNRWQIGAEVFGNFTEHQHFIGPTVGVDANSNIRVLVGAGLGLNHSSPDHVRLVAEYEWF